MSAREEAQKESLDRALGILREMLTDEQYQGMADRVASETDDFGRTSFRHSIGHVYGDTWTRPGLSKKERSLLTIGLMIGLRSPTELGHQVKMAIKNGLTPRQIEEILIHAQPYAGILVTAAAGVVARQSLSEIGVKLADRSPEDK